MEDASRIRPFPADDGMDDTPPLTHGAGADPIGGRTLDGMAEMSSDMRRTPRMALLMRMAKLVSAQGEFVCVVRDVSLQGISIRMFHALPSCDLFTLELQTGNCYDIRKVWVRDRDAGFEFAQAVDLQKIIQETGTYPKRAMRLAICLPITFATRQARRSGTILNLSQQGARIESDALLAIDETICLEGHDLGDVHAKVRWRKGREYGLVFDDTFSLQDFARLAARLQAPGLLRG